MLIDCHTHLFPESLAERAVAHLERVYDVKAVGHATREGLRKELRAAGIAAAIALTVAERPSQVEAANDWTLGLRGEEDFIPFGTLHPDHPDWRGEVRRLKEGGILGVKLQPNFQDFFPDERRLYPIYEALEGEGLILLIHCGDEIKPIPNVLSTPSRIGRVKRDHPGLKLVVPHLGGYKMWDEAEEHLLGQDLYLDTSYVLDKMPPERAISIIRRHGPERVLFGSDYPFARPSDSLVDLTSLGLTPQEEEAILGQNARRLLGL